jgi:hypothetical protein
VGGFYPSVRDTAYRPLCIFGMRPRLPRFCGMRALLVRNARGRVRVKTVLLVVQKGTRTCAFGGSTHVCTCTLPSGTYRGTQRATPALDTSKATQMYDMLATTMRARHGGQRAIA